MDNDDRKRVFEDTQRMWERDELLSKAVGDSIFYQKRYLAGDGERETKKPWLGTHVYVWKHRTTECAALYKDTHVAVLNFADYYVPGGRVKQGASSQEECLCRVSTLYPCIASQAQWYKDHAGNTSAYYTDDLIYTPGVVVFKDDNYYSLPREHWFKTDVITCAAPNNQDHTLDGGKLREVFRQRWGRILDVAASYNVDTLVLGAFGCGVFGNDPKMVAETAYDAIIDRAGTIGSIVFAIPAGPNFEAFEKTFERKVYFEAME